MTRGCPAYQLGNLCSPMTWQWFFQSLYRRLPIKVVRVCRCKPGPCKSSLDCSSNQSWIVLRSLRQRIWLLRPKWRPSSSERLFLCGVRLPGLDVASLKKNRSASSELFTHPAPHSRMGAWSVHARRLYAQNETSLQHSESRWVSAGRRVSGLLHILWHLLRQFVMTTVALFYKISF